MNKIPLFVVVVAVLGAFSLLVVVVLTIEPADDPDSLDVEAHADFQGPFIPIQADELYRSYKKNEKAADLDFRGKGVEITGLFMGTEGEYSLRAGVDNIAQIEKIRRSRGFRRAVFFTDDLGIICLVPEKNATQFLNLTNKGTVTLQGVCAGMRSESDPQNGSHVYITGCRLVKK